MELPYHLAIPSMVIYLKKMKSLSQGDICTVMFIEALFTVAKIWQYLSIHWWLIVKENVIINK